MSAVCLLSADCLLFVTLASGVLEAAAVRVVEEEVDPLAAAGGQVGPDHVGEGGERAANLHRAHRVPETNMTKSVQGDTSKR